MSLNEVDPAANRSTGNGSTKIFAYTFKIAASSEIEVLIDSTVKTLTTHYTLSGIGASGGGNVTFITAPASGTTVTLLRKQPGQQLSTYVANEAFPHTRIESDFDKVWMAIQQIREQLYRVISMPKSSPGSGPTLPDVATRANKYLTFDGSGNPTATAAATASGTSVTATGSITARLLADRFTDWVNVKDYGAIGNGVADDYAAISAAIATLDTNNGGTVLFPSGTYNVGTTITLSTPGITLMGMGATGSTTSERGATIIRATHSSGDVIRVKKLNCSIRHMTISSDTARYTGAAGSNYGIRVEDDDTASGFSARQFMENVRVTRQPNHGLLLIGAIASSTLLNVDVDNVKGHGIVVNSGTITSRTNITRPGQVSIINARIHRVDGHAMAIGQSGTTNTLDIPYRVIVSNLETFYAGVNGAALYKNYAVYVFGDNHEFSGSAFGGYRESDGADVYGGIYLEGRFIRLINNRYIDCNAYAIEVGNRASYATEDIVLDGGYINNGNQSAGFYNPAILVDSAAKNVHANFHTANTDVTTLMGTTSTNYEIDFRNAYVTNKNITGATLAATTALVSPKIQVDNTALSLADDKAAYLTFSGITRGSIVISANASGGKGALVHFRVGDGSAHATIMASSGAGVVGQTGQLAGTTGTDGNLTIAADTANNRLYIENRTASTRVYTFSVLGSDNGIYQSTTVV